MRRIILVLSILCSAGWVNAQGNAGDFGLGGVIGSPMGLTGKWWMSGETAMAFIVGAGDSNLELAGDFLWHTEQIFPRPREGRLPFYLGLGGRVQFEEDDPEVGIRFVVGMEYLLSRAPLGVFAELVPVLDFTPDVEGDFSGGVGIRYYFGHVR